MRILQLRTFLLFACAPLLLAGCIDVFFDPVDPDPVDPAPTSVARERFINEVFPILSASCGTCHAGPSPTLGFVGREPVEGYALILSFPALLGGFQPSAPILNIPAAGHQGLTYTPSERSSILAWLDAELAERGGGPPPVSAVEAAIRTWSGCLDFSDFTATNMAPAFSALTSSSGTCMNCHGTGDFGVLITPDAQQFFQVMTTRRAFLLGFFTVDVTAGLPAAKMVANTVRFQSVGSQQPPHNLHPAFAFANSPAQKALVDLHFATEQRRLAATCGPPRLID